MEQQHTELPLPTNQSKKEKVSAVPAVIKTF